MCIAQG
ncbi:hypothetical protein YPPY48_2900, partial [Yersinia pestis PY-48]